jgi:hypothetical protein
MGTTNKTEAQTAKEFGVPKAQLRKFITQDAKKSRRSFNQSPSTRKLFAEIGAPKPRYKGGQRIETVRGTRIIQFDARPATLDQIRRTPGLSESERSRRLQVGNLIQRHYTFQDRPEYHWAEFTREHKLPTSINALKILRRNDRIPDAYWNQALKAWKDIYGISDKYFTDTIGEDIDE